MKLVAIITTNFILFYLPYKNLMSHHILYESLSLRQLREIARDLNISTTGLNRRSLISILHQEERHIYNTFYENYHKYSSNSRQGALLNLAYFLITRLFDYNEGFIDAIDNNPEYYAALNSRDKTWMERWLYIDSLNPKKTAREVLKFLIAIINRVERMVR